MTTEAPDPLAGLVRAPGVEPGVAAARAAVDSVLNHRVVRRRSPDVSAESSLRGAWGASRLAGSDATLEQVRTGAVIDDPVVQGALRAYSAMGELAGSWSHAPSQALARLHVLAAADLVEDRSVLGRPARRAPVPERMMALGELLAVTRAPAVVLAAVVHAEIASLDAFAPASAVAACVAARLVLIDRGLDPKSLVPVEIGLLAEPGGWSAALGAYAGGRPEDVVAWVCRYAAAVVDGARESLAICEALQRG